jgi:type I phosphodiesterase/nucleotide pyrophosphatase
VLARRFISQGRLPHLAKLSSQGSFHDLRTTYPAISPVAWSTFMTGVNPGKHNIYDFLARDLSNYLPFLSSAEILPPKRSLKIGKYTIALGKPTIKGMRRGTPFWHWLGKAGISCNVIRVPATFPPEKFSGVLLSGMCVPDLKGSQGTFCFCTTQTSGDKYREGGVRVPMARDGVLCRSYIPGPPDPLAGESGGEAGSLQGCCGDVHLEGGRIFGVDLGPVQRWAGGQRARHLPLLSQTGFARSGSVCYPGEY